MDRSCTLALSVSREISFSAAEILAAESRRRGKRSGWFRQRREVERAAEEAANIEVREGSLMAPISGVLNKRGEGVQFWALAQKMRYLPESKIMIIIVKIMVV